MGRPSQGIDKALLKAGAEEIKEKGVRGLSVRAVSSRAGVSIRMLNYYFGSKDNFIRLVMAANYDEFFAVIDALARKEGSPLLRLRNVVRFTLEHMAENRDLARNLWMDAHAGEPLVLEVLRGHCPAHSGLMLDLIRKAQNAGEIRNDMAASQIFMAVLPGVYMPNFWTDGMLPMADCMFPENHVPVIGDSVEYAMRNFDCLVEGFRLKTGLGEAPEPLAALAAQRPPATNNSAPSGEACLCEDGPGSGRHKNRLSSPGRKHGACYPPRRTERQKRPGNHQ